MLFKAIALKQCASRATARSPRISSPFLKGADRSPPVLADVRGSHPAWQSLHTDPGLGPGSHDCSFALFTYLPNGGQGGAGAGGLRGQVYRKRGPFPWTVCLLLADPVGGSEVHPGGRRAARGALATAPRPVTGQAEIESPLTGGRAVSFGPELCSLLAGEQEPAVSSDSDISLIMAMEVGLSDVDLSTDQDCEEVKS